jgi:hypothetical protein
MKKTLFKFLSVAILIFVLVGTLVTAEGQKSVKSKNERAVTEVTGVPRTTVMNINNLMMWAGDDGRMERRPQDDNAGVTFPRGTAACVYAGGLVWAGYVDDGASPLLRVGGQTYNYGTVPGRIITKGVAESPSAPSVRMYRIRRDWKTADLTRDAAEINDVALASVSAGQIDAVRAQYKKDWLEWPWQKGAPYYDRNNNGIYDPDPSGNYDPALDEPGLGGADQVLWYVTNDLKASATSGLYGSPPIGIEMQVTCWAYARTDELGNVIFQRYRIIYKGTSTTPPDAKIDSMYIAKWSDPDLGNYGDDYAGCVKDKSLGFVYNSQPEDAEYKKYDLNPPFVGYDFFQGPRVPEAGSTARWDLQVVSGYKNLPMTTFAYFAAGGFDSDPTLAQYAGTSQWWNLIRGYRPRPITPPEPFIDPTTGIATKYELDGDPTTLRGWIDGRRDSPSDRRLVLSSGPITMALGDTQEVVVGLLAAIAPRDKDYMEGYNLLKKIDDEAQNAFNFNFDLPKNVPAPNLNIVELDNKLILEWESDTAKIRECETYSSKGYRFEGYTLWQFPNSRASTDIARQLAPFDVTGPRSRVIEIDKFKNRPLVNGQPYYFAIQTIVYNPDPSVKSRLESAPIIKTAIPHSPNPGTVYPYELQEPQSLAQNTVGKNDATVFVSYNDPTKPDGHTYSVVFHSAVTETWDFVDKTENDTLIKGVVFDAGTSSYRSVTRGLTLTVNVPKVGVKGVYLVKSDGQTMREPLFTVPDPKGEFYVIGNIVDDRGNSTVDTMAGGNRSDRDIEWRFGDSSWAIMAIGSSSFWKRVPYQMWQLGNGSTIPDRQLYTVIVPPEKDSSWRATKLLSRSYNNKPLKTFYPVAVYADSYKVGSTYYGGRYYDDIPSKTFANLIKGVILTNISIPKDPVWAIARAYLADLNDDGVLPPAGTVIRFEKYKAIVEGDVKEFTTTKTEYENVSAAQTEVNKINVFPNPYYGVNTQMASRQAPFVKFNHLPAYAKIRIFNLAGHIVRTLDKVHDASAPSQFLTWDLQNENGLPVSSGIYLAYLELKDVNGNDLGTKTLKLMIIQEQQYLDNF